MRIARIRHLFYPDMPQDYFYELSAQQANRGHDVSVVTWSRNGKPSTKEATGFKIVRLRGLNLALLGAFKDYPFLPGISSQLKKIKPDLVHAESHLFLPSFQAVLEAKKLGVPSIVTVHGVFAERGLAVNLLQKAYLHTFGLMLFKKSDKIICLTQSDAKEILALGCSKNKVIVIPNAIDINLFSPSIERSSTLIVWVGRFVPEKGVEYLIKAAKIVSEQVSGITFLLIGYGPLKTKMMQLAEDSGLLETTVIFSKPLSRREISKILSKATIFVCPSLKEGLPLSVLEAMASGTPVIGSDVSGVKDIIVDQFSGLLFPSKNSDKLAECILSLLLNEKNCRQMGKNARQSIIQSYTWDLISHKLDVVYKELVYGSN